MDRTYLVECYWPGVTPQGYADAVTRAGDAIRDLRDVGRDVRLLDSLLVPADEAVFYRLAARSISDVEAVCQRADLQAARIVEYVDTRDAPDDKPDEEAGGGSLSSPP